MPRKSGRDASKQVSPGTTLGLAILCLIVGSLVLFGPGGKNVGMYTVGGAMYMIFVVFTFHWLRARSRS
ncbi:hypothetical protein [Streptomyces sp. SID3343]|uniref:hypothetical protein n=1 Tax=Streptomyces sp. SID3343 TaxID=2690260 RepID=UPI0013722519|nr:hypothetical protein [Streptomyces sp. SID3343]MYV97269.1 hypothetical protein [Streptomyces sp. SID3343]